MSPKEFEDWCTRMGLSEQAAADALGLTVQEVVDYQFGDRDRAGDIPLTVELACAALSNGLSREGWRARTRVGDIEARTEGLRLRLLHLFPDFAGQLVDALGRQDDGSFTPCGLMSEFGTYVRTRIEDFDSEALVDAFALFETIAAADPNDRDPVANAVFTCFLENIAGTQAGEAARHLMGPACAKFFVGWHGQPPYQP